MSAPTSSKPKFIDFQVLKQTIRIEDSLPLFGLKPVETGDQLRSPCPSCQSGGDRALVVTKSKQAFYCFAANSGGDVIGLAAHIKDLNMKEAAAFLADGFKQPEPPATVLGHSSPEKKKAGQPPRLNPLTYLQAEHPLVQALGISPETARHFGAGYAPKGIMRGRLAIPIHDAEGNLLAYCGRALRDETPTLLFPTDFDPRKVIFNAHRAGEGLLTLVRDPMAVLKAHENGIRNVASILTATIAPQQLIRIATLMETISCEAIDLV